MINVKPDIFSALTAACTGADVSDEFPKEWKTFPKVTYTEEDNSTYSWEDNAEGMSRVVIRIDCWDKTSTATVVGQVDSAMTALGFIRTQCRDVPVPEENKHKQLRYEAIIDVDNKYVFHE